MSSVAPGIDPGAVTAWFARHVPGVRPPLTFALLPGGRSNLTVLVTDQAGGRWVLRRPPLRGVLPQAHDVAREHGILAALANTAVPVPRPIGQEPDPTVTGAPFSVVEYVEGVVLRRADDARRLDPAARRRAGAAAVEVLAALHGLDPDAIGLGDLGPREDYLARQLHRWHDQLRRTRERGGRDLTALDEVHERLRAAIPPQQGVAIVHGDYRIDNLLLTSAGEVAAVLDWELCTLGDPLADLGLFCLFWPDPGETSHPLPPMPSVVEGFPPRTELIAQYAARTGLDVSALGYYVAFASWKVAVILEGVVVRYTADAYGDNDDGQWQTFSDLAARLADHARAIAA